MRRDTLAWVSAGREYDGLPLRYLALAAVEVRDDELVAVVAGATLAEHALPDEVCVLLGAYLLLQVVHQVRVVVWIAVGDVYVVGVVVENHLEGQGALVPSGSLGLRQVILEVFDVVAISIPPNTTRLGPASRVEKGLHTLSVLAVCVLEVVDVEPVLGSLRDIRDPEIEPLCRLGEASITLHVEVVLVLADSVSLMKIAGLEPALKKECVIVLVLQVVVLCQLGVVPVSRATAGQATGDPIRLVDVRCGDPSLGRRLNRVVHLVLLAHRLFDVLLQHIWLDFRLEQLGTLQLGRLFLFALGKWLVKLALANMARRFCQHRSPISRLRAP